MSPLSTTTMATEATRQVTRKRKRRQANEGEKEERKAKFLKKIEGDNKKVKGLSFNKRNPTLQNKARELSNMCDSSVCLVCIGPQGNVSTWPPNPTEVVELIDKYNELEKKDRVVHNMEEFFNSKLNKLEKKKKNLIERRINDVISSMSSKISKLDGDALVHEANHVLVPWLEKFKTKIEELKRSRNHNCELEFSRDQTFINQVGVPDLDNVNWSLYADVLGAEDFQESDLDNVDWSLYADVLGAEDFQESLSQSPTDCSSCQLLTPPLMNDGNVSVYNHTSNRSLVGDCRTGHSVGVMAGHTITEDLKIPLPQLHGSNHLSNSVSPRITLDSSISGHNTNSCVGNSSTIGGGRVSTPSGAVKNENLMEDFEKPLLQSPIDGSHYRHLVSTSTANADACFIHHNTNSYRVNSSSVGGSGASCHVHSTNAFKKDFRKQPSQLPTDCSNCQGFMHVPTKTVASTSGHYSNSCMGRSSSIGGSSASCHVQAANAIVEDFRKQPLQLHTDYSNHPVLMPLATMTDCYGSATTASSGDQNANAFPNSQLSYAPTPYPPVLEDEFHFANGAVVYDNGIGYADNYGPMLKHPWNVHQPLVNCFRLHQ